MAYPPPSRICLLDGFTVTLAGSRAVTEGLPHGVQRLIAHVCLLRRPTRTVVAGQLWPDVSEEQAHGSLRSALWRLNRVAPGLVSVSGNCLAVADGVGVDVREVSDWARRAVEAGADLGEVSVPEHGLHGDLLPGWYEDWVLLERERLRQLRLHALEAVARRLVLAGRPGEALETAYAAVETEPLRESAHRTVVQVHLVEGNVVEAVRAYERFRTLLADELGVEPTARMTALVRDVTRRTTAGRLPRPRVAPAASHVPQNVR